MAFCKLSDSAILYDVTPLENLFIQEFLTKAPGDFVKVYVYGLYQCLHPGAAEPTSEAFALALGLETETVYNAFSYWARDGLVRIVSQDPFTVEFYNVKNRLYQNNYETPPELARYSDFNISLQSVLGGRLLHTQDLQKIYDWIEVLGMEPEAVLHMVSYCVERKGRPVSLAYMNKVALSWANDGVRTLEDAERRIARHASESTQTQKVLSHIGVFRTPTVDENRLFNKWTEEWGFSLDAILLACRETTKIQKPNLAYVHRVLASLYEQGFVKAADIEAHFSARDTIGAKLREVLLALGQKSVSPTQAQNIQYARWTREWGMDHETVLAACTRASENGRATFAAVNSLLEGWHNSNIHSCSEAEEMLECERALDGALGEVFRRAGIVRSPGQSDRAAYTKWRDTWGMEEGLLLFAAELSAGANQPWQFLQKLLSNYHKKGVLTLEQARAERRTHTANRQSGASRKKLDGLNYDQRPPEQNGLDRDFDDLSAS
ncbi:MAG: DnaD domain protein [Christensenellales bacterium]|jgi:DnaD/phage-associated family protein